MQLQLWVRKQSLIARATALGVTAIAIGVSNLNANGSGSDGIAADCRTVGSEERFLHRVEGVCVARQVSGTRIFKHSTLANCSPPHFTRGISAAPTSLLSQQLLLPRCLSITGGSKGKMMEPPSSTCSGEMHCPPPR